MELNKLFDLLFSFIFISRIFNVQFELYIFFEIFKSSKIRYKTDFQDQNKWKEKYKYCYVSLCYSTKLNLKKKIWPLYTNDEYTSAYIYTDSSCQSLLITRSNPYILWCWHRLSCAKVSYFTVNHQESRSKT